MVALIAGGVSNAVTPVDDYTVAGAMVSPSPFLVTVPQDTDEISFTIRAVNDTDFEQNGTLTFALQRDISGYTVNDAMAIAVVTISSEDIAPEASIEVSNAIITEGGTDSTTVTVSLGRNAPTGGVPVLIAFTAGGASNATTLTDDYTVEGATLGATFTVIVLATQDEVTFTIEAVDDMEREEDGTLTFTLQEGVGYTVSSTMASVGVTISSDEKPPVASIAVTGNTTITESDADGSCTATMTTNCTTVTVSLNEDAPSGGVAVMVALVASASGGVHDATTLGDDYTVTGATVTTSPFIVTVLESTDEISFTIRAVNDADFERDGTLTFNLQPGGTDYTVDMTPGMASAGVVINSEDPAPMASITIREPIVDREGNDRNPVPGHGTSATIPEDGVDAGRTATLTITLTPAHDDGAVLDVVLGFTNIVTVNPPNVELSFSGTSSVSAFNRTVTLAGTTFTGGTATREITTVIDNSDRDGEGFVFTLMPTEDYTVGDTGAAVTVMIEDDDVTAIDASTLNAVPGNNQMTLVWRNTHHTDINSVIISAVVTGGDNTAIDINGGSMGTDLMEAVTARSISTVTITEGLANGTEYTFSLVVVDNKASGRTYMSAPVTINATPAIVPEASVTVRIGTAAAGTGGQSVAVPEAGSGSTTGRAALFTITLNNADGTPYTENVTLPLVSFSYIPLGGIDDGGRISLDFLEAFFINPSALSITANAVSFTNVSFTSDGTAAATATLTLSVINDADDEGDDQGYTFTLVNGTGYTADTDTMDNTVTVTITDND